MLLLFLPSPFQTREVCVFPRKPIDLNSLAVLLAFLPKEIRLGDIFVTLDSIVVYQRERPLSTNIGHAGDVVFPQKPPSLVCFA